MAGAILQGVLKRDSDNLIEYRNAKDVLSGTTLNNASMVVTVETTEKLPVVGPINGEYILGTSGNYAAVIQDTIDWDLDIMYLVTIVLDGGANLKLTEVIHCSIV